MNDRKLAEARFSLIISGDSLNMERLTERLHMKPTKTVRKGETVARIPRQITAEKDQWICSIELKNAAGEDEALNDMLVRIGDVRGKLKDISKTDSVVMRLFVRDDSAQMSYNLAPVTLANLCMIGLPLEVSSFSWGEVL